MYWVFVRSLRGLAALALMVALSACSSLSVPFDPVSNATDSSSDRSSGRNGNNLFRVHLRVGQTALRNRDYATAAYFLERAHSADRARVAPLLYLGRAYLALKSDARAEAAFHKILVLDTDHVESHQRIANLLIKKGKYKKSLIHLEAALKIAPSVDLHNRAGVAYDLSGNRAKAQTHYRAGLDLDPNDTRLLGNLGLSRLKNEASSRAKGEQNGKNGRRGQNIPFLPGPVDLSSSSKTDDEISKTSITEPDASKQVAEEPVPEKKPAKAPPESVPETPEMRKKTVLTTVPDKQDPIERRDTETGKVEKETIEENNAITTAYSSTLIARQTTENKKDSIPENSIAPPAMSKWRYSVQLAAYNNATTAWRGLSRLTAALDEKNAELRVLIRKRVNGFAGKVKFRVRTIAWPDRARAVVLCGRIKNRGGDCIVVRQTPGLWEPIPAPDTTMQMQARSPRFEGYRIQLGAYPGVGHRQTGAAHPWLQDRG